MDNKQNNEQLAALAKAGDIEARNTLWERNKGCAWVHLRKYVPLCRLHSITEDDLFQCTFFLILIALHQYKPENDLPFLGYFRFAASKTARQLCGWKAMQGKAPPPPVSLQMPVPGKDRDVDELQATLLDEHAQDFVEGLEDAELASAVQGALALLPEQQAEVLRLRYIEGLTLQQIGDRQGRTREAIRQRELRAISAFLALENAGTMRDLF